MRSLLTDDFIDVFKRLPADVRKSARKSYKLWVSDPNHPSLHFKKVKHPESIYSVRISRGWRALGLVEGDRISWFWVGSHADYDKILSQI